MKVLFMGTPEFARANLVALDESRHDLVAVVTGRDSRSGRGRKLAKTSCRIEAEQRGIPVLTPGSLKDPELPSQLAKFGADLFVVAAFRILPKELYTLPRFGSINIHASLLPKYRGAAPINWAIIRGEKETGLTSFFLRGRVDTGDLILQESFGIDDNDTFDILHNRFVGRTGEFLLRTLELIDSGTLTARPQDSRLASDAPKIHPADARIEFNQPRETVRNFIRGMSTKPGAFTMLRGKKIKIHACERVEISDVPSGTPGSIQVDRRRLIVWCADAPLELTSVVPEGKKEMSGKAFMSGFRPDVNERFGAH